MEKLEIVEIIRKIVENEVRKLYIAEIGVVTSVFPHSSDSDKNNYECNVSLKYRDLELRKVPVATQHIGLASIPHVGDLVLITFINGNINAPVVVGRLYTDEDRPPLSKEEEIVYVPPYSENSDLKRIHIEFPGGMELSVKDDVATIKANKTTLTLKRDGNVEIEAKSKVGISGSEIVLSASNIRMESKQNIEIESQQGNMSLRTLQGDTEVISARNLAITNGANIDISNGNVLNITNSGDLVVTNGSNLSINAGGLAVIKGKTVSIN
jgi:phage baseplate assembly protein gpV